MFNSVFKFNWYIGTHFKKKVFIYIFYQLKDILDSHPNHLLNILLNLKEKIFFFFSKIKYLLFV